MYISQKTMLRGDAITETMNLGIYRLLFKKNHYGITPICSKKEEIIYEDHTG